MEDHHNYSPAVSVKQTRRIPPAGKSDLGLSGRWPRWDRQEVLIAEQRLDIRSGHQLLQEALHDLLVEQPLTIFRERVGMLYRIVGAQPHNPTEQQVVVQLLEQEPLRADPVKRLQQRGQQQLFGRF